MNKNEVILGVERIGYNRLQAEMIVSRVAASMMSKNFPDPAYSGWQRACMSDKYKYRLAVEFVQKNLLEG